MITERDKDIIFGRNSVTEAIKAGRPIDSVMVARGERSGSIPKILAEAKDAGIPIKEVDRKKLDFMCGHGNHQGVIAVGAVAAILWRKAKKKVASALHIDENANKEVEEDIVINDEENS